MKVIKKLIKLFLIFAVVMIAVFFALRNIYPLRYYDIICENAEKYGISPMLVAAVIHTESGFDNAAVSGKDAKGLMQLTEGTATWCASKNGMYDFDTDMLYEPEININLGTWYLDYLLEYFNGDYNLALSAYNAGMGNVEAWLKNEKYSADGVKLDTIPYPETEQYIKKIMNNYTIYKTLYFDKER